MKITLASLWQKLDSHIDHINDSLKTSNDRLEKTRAEDVKRHNEHMKVLQTQVTNIKKEGKSEHKEIFAKIDVFIETANASFAKAEDLKAVKADLKNTAIAFVVTLMTVIGWIAKEFYGAVDIVRAYYN